MSGGSATPFQVRLPEGLVNVDARDWGNVAVLTFPEGFGMVEIARGSWDFVCRRLDEVNRDGVRVGPAHVPGELFRWISLPHDGSCRAAVPGGCLHIVSFVDLHLLLFADGQGGCAGVAIGSDVRRLQQRAESWTGSPGRWVIQFRGRRHPVFISSRRNFIAMARVDRTTTIRAIPLATEVPTLLLELHEDGREVEVLGRVPLPLGDTDEILYSDGSELSHRPGHGQQPSAAPTWPAPARTAASPPTSAGRGPSAHEQPPTSGQPAPRDRRSSDHREAPGPRLGGVGRGEGPHIRDAERTDESRQPLQERLNRFAQRRGPGLQMRGQTVTRLSLLADLGVRELRCRATAPALRTVMEEKGPLQGCTRAFRYVRRDLEIDGLLLRQADEFVLPLHEWLTHASATGTRPDDRSEPAPGAASPPPPDDTSERPPVDDVRAASPPRPDDTSERAPIDDVHAASPSASGESDLESEAESDLELEASGITERNAFVVLADGVREFAEAGTLDPTRLSDSVRAFLIEFERVPVRPEQRPAYHRISFALQRCVQRYGVKTDSDFEGMVEDLTSRLASVLSENRAWVRKEPQ